MKWATVAFQTATEKSVLRFENDEKAPSNGHCGGVAFQNPQNGGGEGKGEVCDHCSQPGNLYPVAYGEFSGETHLACQGEWVAARQDLGIPDFLRRAPEVRS